MVGEILTTYTKFDITGKPLAVIDPKQYVAGGIVNTFEYTYDTVGSSMCGRVF